MKAHVEKAVICVIDAKGNLFARRTQTETLHLQIITGFDFDFN
jgi:hypothetical protein